MRLGKSRGLRIGLGIVLGLFLIGFIAGHVYFSKTSLIKRYVQARQKADLDMEDLKPYLVWADTKDYVTFEEARYATFKPLSANQAERLQEALETATAEDDLYVTSIGQRFWLFSDYRIAMKPLQLTIKTNLPQMDLLLNQKKVTTTDTEDFTYVLDRLPQADYEATLSGHYQKAHLSFSKSYDGQTPLIDLTVTFKHFDVLSNMTDGDLMVGKKKIGSLKDGRYQLANFPMTEKADIYVKRQFPDGDLESPKVPLEQVVDGSQLRLDVPDLLKQEEAGQLLVAAFNQFVPYIASQTDPTDLSLFESGVTNGFYRALKESVQKRLVTDARRASRLTIPNIWVNSFRQVGKASYALDYGVSYDYFYDKETDSANQTQGTLHQTINGVATLKKKGDSYIFQSTGNSGLQVVKEDNQVKASTAFPDGLVGTWEGRLTKEKVKVSQTFTEDGNISVTVDYDSSSQLDRTFKANVKEVEEVSSGIYRYVGVSGDLSALSLGLGGLGGAGVTYEYGFQLKGNSLKPIIWQTPQGTPVDYAKGLESGLALTKK